MNYDFFPSFQFKGCKYKLKGRKEWKLMKVQLIRDMSTERVQNLLTSSLGPKKDGKGKE